MIIRIGTEERVIEYARTLAFALIEATRWANAAGTAVVVVCDGVEYKVYPTS